MSDHNCTCGMTFPAHLPKCPECGQNPNTPPALPTPPAPPPAQPWSPARAPVFHRLTQEDLEKRRKGRSWGALVSRVMRGESLEEDDK
jgi:hypothetical protein